MISTWFIKREYIDIKDTVDTIKKLSHCQGIIDRAFYFRSFDTQPPMW
jgi:hypothetical protein